MKRHFFAWVFIVTGLALSYAMAKQILESLAPYGWQKNECQIIQSDVVHAAGQRPACRHALAYRYEISGVRRTGSTWRLDPGVPHAWCSDWASFASRFRPAATVACYVDPRDADRVVLDRGDLLSVFKLALPLGLVFIGIAMVKTRAPMFPPSKATVKRMGRGLAVCLVLAGAIGTLFGGVLPFYGSFDSRTWNQAECEVLSSSLRSSGTSSAPGANTRSRGHFIDIVYTYAVDGRNYVSDRYDFSAFGSGGAERLAQVTDRYPPGAKVPCAVSAANPYDAVLVPGPSARYLWGFWPLLGVLFGSLMWTSMRWIR